MEQREIRKLRILIRELWLDGYEEGKAETEKETRALAKASLKGRLRYQEALRLLEEITLLINPTE